MKYIFLSLIISAQALLFAYQPNSAMPDVWAAVEPYFLPEDHPIKPVLDEIFHSPEVTLNSGTVGRAGFNTPLPRPYSKVVVSKHPRLHGYLVKMYLDDQLGFEDWSHWKQRVLGANAIREAIATYGFEDLFVVPHKWIYPLPAQYNPPSGTNRKQFILIVEDMKILPNSKNLAKWKSKHLSKDTLHAVFVMLTTLGLWDSIYAFNMPFTEEGKIAFIDTEFHHGWPVPVWHLAQYLSRENHVYWENLTHTGG